MDEQREAAAVAVPDRLAVEVAEDTVAHVGHWLVRRGYRALWSRLFAHLASDQGASGGSWEPSVGAVPPDAATRFLEAHPVD